MKLALALVGLAAIAGCSPAPAAKSVTSPSLELLDAVAATCHTPRDWLRVGADERPQLVVPQDAAYDRVACLHRELKKRGAPAKTGLIQGPAR